MCRCIPAFTDFSVPRRAARCSGRIALHASGPPFRLCRGVPLAGPRCCARLGHLAEVRALEALARDRGLTLLATRAQPMAHAVAPARAWLKDATIKSAHITWREDVRKWHPGQDWVFEPGGMGVFDPGINALSIPDRTAKARTSDEARLEFPENRQTPIAQGS